METVALGATIVLQCNACEGVWVGAESFVRFCSDSGRRRELIQALPSGNKTSGVALNWRYHPCPLCRDLMARINFADISAVIVNVCLRHGVWCHRDELRRIVEFIDANGFERSRKFRDEEDAECARNRALLDAIEEITRTWTRNSGGML